MMILSVDIVNIYLLIHKYHDNYILKYIFLKNISIYIYIGKIYIDIKINKLNNNIN